MNYITKDNCPENPGLVVYLDVLYYYQLPPHNTCDHDILVCVLLSITH